jgi:Nidogen-like/Bacterial Ig-like domain (group 3)/Carboxypeptidase regulatory-like domain
MKLPSFARRNRGRTGLRAAPVMAIGVVLTVSIAGQTAAAVISTSSPAAVTPAGKPTPHPPHASPYAKLGGPIKPGPTHPTLTRGSRFTAAAAAPPTQQDDLAYGSGPVMQRTTTYLILWEPPGSTLSQTAALLEEQFLKDLGGPDYGILGQYYQSDGNGGQQHISPLTHFGGDVVYTNPYPHKGTQADPITDADIQAEVRQVINDENTHWDPPGLTTLYEVVLGENIEFCDGSGDCTFAKPGQETLCAYHGSFDVNGTSVVYANNGNQANRACASGLASPNNEPNADADVSIMSHETFEAITDPLLAAWRTPSGAPHAAGQEIGDLCSFQYGAVASDGTNLTMNGHEYQVQEEWSNSTADAQPANTNFAGCAVASGAVQTTKDYPACTANSFGANDDQSTPAITLPFTVNLFSKTFTSLYVNNNGNVTFDAPLPQYTPSGLQATGHSIIAPFFADADTRPGTGIVSYGGEPARNGRPAYFCVDWPSVGYFQQHTDRQNSFQMILIDRSADTGLAGDFDIVFNYDKVQWETGDASGASGGVGGTSAVAGYSNGVNATMQLPGSLIPGSFLDGGPVSLIESSLNSTTTGRYVFPVRNSGAPTGGTIHGTVTADLFTTKVFGAQVQLCQPSTGACTLTQTNKQGAYSAPGLVPGNYVITVNPPSGSSLFAGTALATLAANGNQQQDIDLVNASATPGSVSLGSSSVNAFGVPVLAWGTGTTIGFSGCPNGQATATVSASDGSVTRTVPLTIDRFGLGEYSGTIPDLQPAHGPATVTVTNTCPDSSMNQTVTFDVYVDPSGTVVDQNGSPVSGATVTLLRSDYPSGPFAAVPAGSAVMSPANRDNPVTTSAGGRFGWDVLSGYYEIRAAKAGCATAVRGPFRIPPPVSDLVVTLNCATAAATTLTLTAPPSGDYHDAVTVSATLTVTGGGPVAGKPVSFSLAGNESCTATTNSAGSAACSVTPGEPSGPTTLRARFAGDSAFGASSASAAFTVTPEETTIAYTGPGKVANGVPVTMSGVLKEDGSTPIAGRSVTIALGSGTTRQACTGTTDTIGTAACQIPVMNQPLTDSATLPVTVSFAGDAFYRPSTASATVRLEYYTGRGYGISANVNLLLASLLLPPQPDTGPIRTASASSTTTPCTASISTLLVSANVLCANVTTTLAPGTSTTTATVQNTTIGLPGLPVIGISGLTATSVSSCTATSGSSTLTLTIAGNPITVPTAPNSVIGLSGGARLVVNEQVPVPGADFGTTVNAVHVIVPGLLGGADLADVVVGSATSDTHNCT